jgi:cobalt-zinc-cadmium efflux system outer membrane protein
MKLWIFIIGVLVLAGCARFQPQPLAPAQNAQRLEERSLTNETLKTFLQTNLHREFPDWPVPAWDFDLLTLAAFYYHPGLEVARAQWAVARGGEITAAQRPNPSINATPGYDTTTSIPSPWIPLTFLDIPIETAGKRGYRKAQAAHLAEAARLNVASTAWQIRSDLRSALIEFVSAQQHEALLQRQVAVEEQVVKLLQGQVQAGAIAGSQLVPFRIALVRARLDLIDAQRLVSEAQVHVAEAIGVPLKTVQEVKLTFTGLENLEIITQLASAEVRRIALQSRPDILGALAEYAASQSALQLEIAKQYPDIRLEPGYQYDQGDNKWSLGIIVDLPILNQNQGPIAEAKARRQEAAARFNALQVKVLAEIDRATEAVQVAGKNSLALRALVEEQTKHLDAVDAQMRAGAVDQIELLNAQFESLTAELAQVDGRLKLQQAVASLEDAVRRPFELPPVIFESTQNEKR